jgi:hypothetical protein
VLSLETKQRQQEREKNLTIVPVARTAMTVCASSALPSGWVVTREVYVSDRPAAASTCQHDAAQALSKWNHTFIQKTIQPALPTVMQVCTDSPLPKGYRVIQHAIYVLSCRGDQGTSKLIAPITPHLKR